MIDIDPPQTISAVVITKNEESNIEDCLKSVSWADEIVVLDSGSTDRTVAIAREFTDAVFVEEWRGMGAQKNRAVELARGPWIIQLDADERASVELGREIHTALSEGNAAAYSTRRKNYYKGQWIRHCGWWPDRVIRMFKKGHAYFSEEAIHASLQVTSRVGRLTNPIIHYSFTSPEDFLSRARSYAIHQSREMHAQGKTASVWTAISHGLFALMHTYFVRLGFLDGAAGVLISMSNCVGVFYRYMMLRELSQGGNIAHDL